MVINVTVDSLEKKFKGEGMQRFIEIASLGGFGSISEDHTGGIPANYAGGLDLTGVLDPENEVVKPAAKNVIRELAGLAAEAKKVEKGDK